jgi:hypothetical protein
MSTHSVGFTHGLALRRFASQLAEGAQCFVIGTQHLCVEGAKSSQRYVQDLARGLATKQPPIDMERAAELAAFTIVTEQPKGEAS